jgi:hypothetical protein
MPDVPEPISAYIRFFLAADPRLSDERLRKRVEMALMDERQSRAQKSIKVWDWTCPAITGLTGLAM